MTTSGQITAHKAQPVHLPSGSTKTAGWYPLVFVRSVSIRITS